MKPQFPDFNVIIEDDRMTLITYVGEKMIRPIEHITDTNKEMDALIVGYKRMLQWVSESNNCEICSKSLDNFSPEQQSEHYRSHIEKYWEKIKLILDKSL